MSRRVGCTTHRNQLCDYGMWRFSLYHSCSTIDVAKVYLNSATDVVRYSFIVRKSLTYLDLSVGEYGKREKLCYTTDAYKNSVLSKRYVLYSHHLDVSKELDDISEFNASLYKTISDTGGFFLKKILVVDQTVYNMNIKPYIVTAVQKSNNKTRALMNYIKLLSIQRINFANDFIIYLKLISKERRDSELVCQLLRNHPFYAINFFFVNYDEHLVDFALYHATRAKCRLFGGIRLLWKQYLSFGRYECFYQLIKYGYNYPFFSGEFLSCLRNVTDYCLGRNSSTNYPKWDFFSSYRRQNIFILTVNFFLFRNKNEAIQSTDVVTIFWQAIPDRFLTCSEISEGCDRLYISTANKDIFFKFYESNVSLRLLVRPTPRSLLHLCRCSIREHMGSSFKLPHGIDELNIPGKIKKYLKLNIIDEPF